MHVLIIQGPSEALAHIVALTQAIKLSEACKHMTLTAKGHQEGLGLLRRQNLKIDLVVCEDVSLRSALSHIPERGKVKIIGLNESIKRFTAEASQVAA